MLSIETRMRIANHGYTSFWFGHQLRREVQAAQEGLCAICGLPMDVMETTLDHVWPKGKNGYDGPGNFVGAHKWCNHEKGDTYPDGCQIVWLVAVNARLKFETKLTISDPAEGG